MAAYGIGRVPEDVDPDDEMIAEIEAAGLMGARRVGDAEFAPTGTTPGRPVDDERCRCGELAIGWNPGAGEYLCREHWDSY